MTQYFGLVFVAFFLLWGCSTPDDDANTRPNIVLIMADDMGYGGIGAYGNTELSTPHLDSLAAAGIRFTDFHANAPVYTPTRAALLTGMYQQRSGLEGVIYVGGPTRQVGMDSSVTTLGDLFRQGGYATGIMGKWHLGYKEEYNPVNHGFDEFYGFLSGNVDYHSHYDNSGIYDWWHNLDSIREEGYSTDLITEHAVDFIDQHRDGPFLLYVPHESPHVPFQGRRDSAYRFPGREFSYYGPVEDTAATYNEMVEVLDEGVGDIMAALRRNGLEENTLVFFLSDNGAERFGHNGGLRGSKTTLWEGGHRVPAIAYWKGRIAPGESSALLMSMDVLPTLLSVAGISASPNITFDGVDFSGLLFGQEAGLPERTVFWRYRGNKVAREGPWKLLVTESDTSLYHLSEDLKETRDQSAQNPDIREELLQDLEEWEKDVDVEQKTL